MSKRIFIGAAWPYANGSLHLGHLASLLSADIIARYFRLKGNPVLFVSGSDCHGTPIVVEAERRKLHPSLISEKYHQEFKKTLIQGLNFSYDLYTKTTTKNHKKVVQDIFLKLYQKGYIYKKDSELPYCSHCQRFLPDRYIEGQCPICHFKGGRGDQCDECGRLLDPHQLINPRCKICGAIPKWRESQHFFFRLSAFENKLKSWVKQSQDWRPNAKKFTLNLLNQGLKDRAITRDTEWGVPIPLLGYETKRIYVWFEAVCGYLSAAEEWAKQKGALKRSQDFWQGRLLLHFYVHGKDNIPFHTIIWPAILMAYNDASKKRLHLPDRIISSEFLTLEGRQFSTSRQWAIWLPDFLKEFEPDPLRYYLTIYGPETGDSDFSWKEYQSRVNNELVSNFANFIYRTLSFLKAHFPSGIKLGENREVKGLPLGRGGKELVKLSQKCFLKVGSHIEKGQFREGLKSIMELSQNGNRYLQDTSPWLLIKKDQGKTERSLIPALYTIKCLTSLVNPYLPLMSKHLCQMLGLDLSKLQWKASSFDFVHVKELHPLFQKIEDGQIKKQLSRLVENGKK